MTEHVCVTCKERFDVTIGRARAFTCIPCQDRIDKALRSVGYTKESAKTQRLAVIDRVREEGWAVLDTLSKRASTTTRVPKVEKPIAAGDVLAQYLARITAWREAEATAKVEKARIAKEAERACLNEDKKVDAAKARLDEFSRINAAALKPILLAMAAPIKEQEEIERQRQEHARQSEEAAARRAEMVKEMRDTA